MGLLDLRETTVDGKRRESESKGTWSIILMVGGRSDGLTIRIHKVIVIPRNLVIPAVLLGSRVEFLPLSLIGTEVREAQEGFSELWGKSVRTSSR